MYETYWNPEIKQARTRYVKSFGYVEELKTSGIPDPVRHFKAVVRKEEEERRARLNDETRPRAFDENLEKDMTVNGIYAMQQGYDEAGNVNHEVVLDGEGNASLHPDGWCWHDVAYDDLKRKVSERWYSVDGEPALFKGSYSGIDRAFDNSNNVISETYYDATGDVGPNKDGIITIDKAYDDQKHIIHFAYFDEQDHPMAVKGVYQMAMSYDEAGNLISEVVLDAADNHALNPVGWCEHTIAYNELKQKIAERWLDVDGNPALVDGSHSGVDRVFDENGNAIRETYHDITGDIGPNKMGILTIQREYDDQKHVIRYYYLDAEDQPMAVNGV